MSQIGYVVGGAIYYGEVMEPGKIRPEFLSQIYGERDKLADALKIPEDGILILVNVTLRRERDSLDFPYFLLRKSAIDGIVFD